MKKAIKSIFALFFPILSATSASAAGEANKPETKAVDNYAAVFDAESIIKSQTFSAVGAILVTMMLLDLIKGKTNGSV